MEWCRKNISVKEYAAWVYRINKEIEAEQETAAEPRREDYYAMQIAAEIRSLRFAMTGQKKEVNLDDFKLQPKDKSKTQKTEKDVKKTTRKAQTAVASRMHTASVPDFQKWQRQSMKSSLGS